VQLVSFDIPSSKRGRFLWIIRQSITRLAAEVDEALEADVLYGPKHDRWRHIVGVEYEVVLEDRLRSMGTSSPNVVSRG